MADMKKLKGVGICVFNDYFFTCIGRALPIVGINRRFGKSAIKDIGGKEKVYKSCSGALNTFYPFSLCFRKFSNNLFGMFSCRFSRDFR